MPTLTRSSSRASSSASQLHGTPPTAASTSSDNICHRPFNSIHECPDGVQGRGYAKGSVLKHIHDRHLSSVLRKAMVRDSITRDMREYEDLEKMLQTLRMWFCSKCMYFHAWSKYCKGKEGNAHDYIPGPGDGVRVLIHGLNKPGVEAERLQGTAGAVVTAEVDVTAVAGSGKGVCDDLSIDLLNKVLQRQIPTVKSIPHKCRLTFSRALKACLDRIAASPGNVTGWLRLLLLPICTLPLYVPKTSAEKKSGNRRKLQVAAISQALVEWREPNGCYGLVQKLLQQPIKSGSRKLDEHDEKKAADKRFAAMITACQNKISAGHYAAAIKVLSSSGVAPFEEQTYLDLLDKHPEAPPPIFPRLVLMLIQSVWTLRLLTFSFRDFNCDEAEKCLSLFRPIKECSTTPFSRVGTNKRSKPSGYLPSLFSHTHST